MNLRVSGITCPDSLIKWLNSRPIKANCNDPIKLNYKREVLVAFFMSRQLCFCKAKALSYNSSIHLFLATLDPTLDATLDSTLDATLDATLDPALDATLVPSLDATLHSTLDPTLHATLVPSLEL